MRPRFVSLFAKRHAERCRPILCLDLGSLALTNKDPLANQFQAQTVKDLGLQSQGLGLTAKELWKKLGG